ncbi:MAG: hypothetical protein AB8D78_12015 [Akkermansiaceae bacterium]
MKNLSPHRRFKGIPRPDTRLGTFYRHPWPKDLPPQCSVCGIPFVVGFNLTIGPSKTAQILKKTAAILIMPCWLGALFLPHFLVSKLSPPYEDIGAALFFPMVFTPAILIGIGLSLPTKRCVTCKKCGLTRYYRIAISPDLQKQKPI